MGSCLIEVGDIAIDHALELLLVEDEEVVQAFLPHTSGEAFTDSIGSWGMNRRFEDLDRARFRYPSKATEAVRATQESVGDRVTPTWITRRDFSSTMKKAKSGRKNRSVTCKKSHAQICEAWLLEIGGPPLSS